MTTMTHPARTVAEHVADTEDRAAALRVRATAAVVYVIADSERSTACKAASPVIAALLPTATPIGLPVLTVSDVQAYRIDLTRPEFVILTAKAASILVPNGRPLPNAAIIGTPEHDSDHLAAMAVRHGAGTIVVLPVGADWLRESVEAAYEGRPTLVAAPAPAESGTPAERTARQLLAKVEEWRDERADLSAAEDNGGADWSGSDDDGCDLASRLADVVEALLAERE